MITLKQITYALCLFIMNFASANTLNVDHFKSQLPLPVNNSEYYVWAQAGDFNTYVAIPEQNCHGNISIMRINPTRDDLEYVKKCTLDSNYELKNDLSFNNHISIAIDKINKVLYLAWTTPQNYKDQDTRDLHIAKGVGCTNNDVSRCVWTVYTKENHHSNDFGPGNIDIKTGSDGNLYIAYADWFDPKHFINVMTMDSSGNFTPYSKFNLDYSKFGKQPFSPNANQFYLQLINNQPYLAFTDGWGIIRVVVAKTNGSWDLFPEFNDPFAFDGFAFNVCYTNQLCLVYAHNDFNISALRNTAKNLSFVTFDPNNISTYKQTFLQNVISFEPYSAFYHPNLSVNEEGVPYISMLQGYGCKGKDPHIPWPICENGHPGVITQIISLRGPTQYSSSNWLHLDQGSNMPYVDNSETTGAFPPITGDSLNKHYVLGKSDISHDGSYQVYTYSY